MPFKPELRVRYLIPILSVALSVVGLTFIYSASSYYADLNYGDPFFYVKKQALALGAGVIVMFFAGKIKPTFLYKIRWVVLFFSYGILALVFIPGLGVESYGATRWIDVGFMTVQPSEIAKFGLMLFLAAYMTERPQNTVKNMVVPIVCGGAMCLLIMIEPNMSVTVCVGLCLLLMIFVGGSKKRWFVLLIALLLVAVPVLILAEPYRVKRIVAFLDPWENPLEEGYQLIQSYYAIGSGGLFGVGLFASRQKYLFLPFSESDFIFSVIAEETGFFGCFIVLSLFTLLIFLGVRVAMNAQSRFESLLSFGFTAVVAVQTLLNVAVVTGSVPPTGLPLPFVSAGGSSLVSFLFASGVLYGVAKRSDNNVVSVPRKSKGKRLLLAKAHT